MSKKITIITILIVALVVLAGAIIYIVQQKEAKKVKQDEVVTPTKEPIVQSKEPIPSESIVTSDWRVYVKDHEIFLRNRSLGIKKKVLSIYDLPKKVLGLTVENKFFCDAIFSPDRTEILFSVIGPPRGGLPPETEGKTTAHEWIGVLNLKTGNIKAVYAGPGCGILKWSSNKKYIVVEGIGEYSGLPYLSIIDVEHSTSFGSISIPKPEELGWEEELSPFGAKFSEDSQTIYFYTLPTDDYFDLQKHCVSRQSIGDLWKYDIKERKAERIK